MKNSDKLSEFKDGEFQALQQKRVGNKRVVFTNGCFDLLHIGHIRYLKEAKDLGDLLVLGLNSDSSVKRLKGESRPIIPEQERKEVLCALRVVDFVFIFNEDTPLELIKKIHPDILVKGGDWPLESIVGGEFVRSYGGMLKSLSFVDDHSTSAIIKKLNSLGCG